MEILKRIWNYRPDTEPVRFRAMRGLALFFAFMVCCTIVSRAADSLTVKEAQTGAPRRMALTHTLELDGILEAADKLPVLAPENALITSVNIAAGDTVMAGEPLFVCDLEEIRQEFQQKSLELSKLELELDEIEENAVLKEEKKRAALDRAFEDYDDETKNTSFQVKNARDAMNRAKHDLREYVRDGGGDEDYSEAAYNALKDAYQEKKRFYEQAQMEEEQALKKAGRSIEDAVPEEYTREKELKQADIEAKQLELAALKKKMALGGIIYAPADGMISELNAAAGKRMGGEAAAYLTTGGLQFNAELTESQKKEADRGGTVELKLADNRTLTDLNARVSPAAEKKGTYRLTVDVPDGEGEAGTSVAVMLKRKTAVYETCVPLSAVHGQGQEAYVLAVREAETALGTESVVEKVSVTVEDSNESYAAVSGPLSAEDLVVTEAAILSDRDRIRPVET